MKKGIIIIIISFLSLIVSIFSNYNAIKDLNLILPIIFTILGLCLTTYVFICSPISNIVINNNKLYKSAMKLIVELESNMKLIFYFSIVIICTDLLNRINFPCVVNPQNINFGAFTINSAKELIVNFIITSSYLLSLYTFYDLMSALFLIVKGTLFNVNNKNK